MTKTSLPDNCLEHCIERSPEILQELSRDPALYTPFDKGVYQVAPLLRPFGHDFGNGLQDSKLFQIDKFFPRYFKNKVETLSQNRQRHYVKSDLSKDREQTIALWILERFCSEHPLLVLQESPLEYVFKHTGHRVVISDSGDLLSFQGPPAEDLLEALGYQFQEDFSIWRADQSKDWMALAAVCAPSHWAPEKKIGLNFFEVHKPIAGSGPLLKSSTALVQSMIQKGPFVRFVWALNTDQDLNHHPEHKISAPFNPQQTPQELFVRVERQSLFPFPPLESSLFCIRTYFLDCNWIKTQPPLLNSLIDSIESIQGDSLDYKGLRHTQDSILSYLRGKT